MESNALDHITSIIFDSLCNISATLSGAVGYRLRIKTSLTVMKCFDKFSRGGNFYDKQKKKILRLERKHLFSSYCSPITLPLASLNESNTLIDAVLFINIPTPLDALVS